VGDSFDSEFGTIDLGDERRDNRLRLVGNRLWESPDRSIKAASCGLSEVIAAYRLFNNKHVTVSKILEPHRESSLIRARKQSRVLVVQDTTELDFTKKTALRGSGPLSVTKRRGFFAHTNFLIGDGRLPLGIWASDIYARLDEEHGKGEARKSKTIEDKESHRWLAGYQHACEVAEKLPDTEIVSISDREGDVYEVFAERQKRLDAGQRAADWLIRANQNRRLEGKDLGKKLFEKAEGGKRLGKVQFTISSKEQYKKKSGSNVKVQREGREVEQEIRAAKVELKAPWRKPGWKLPSLKVWVLSALEKNPPKGQDPVCWKLITSLAIESLSDAKEVLEMYLDRWEIEVFHRVLKTGCRVEEIQLKDDAALKPCLALYEIIAWRILYFTHLGRVRPDLRCGAVFEDCEWRATVTVLSGKKAAKKEPTLGEFIKLIGQLGGHLGRKHDGMPGPQAIWMGLRRIRDFALAYKALEGD